MGGGGVWWGDEGFGPNVLWQEIGVLAQPIARSLDLDDACVVQQAIEERGGDDGIAEDVAPFGEATVRGQDHGAALVSGVDELEEEVEPRRVRGRLGALSQAAMAACSCSSRQRCSASAGRMSPIGSGSRRVENRSTHSKVAYSSASKDRHGPRRWITTTS